MTQYKSDLLNLLDERGYIHQITDASGLDALAARQVVPVYIGFDATAPSLHVGNLVSIMLLRRVQQAGHKPIVIMGGGTTKVGDPSGKGRRRSGFRRAQKYGIFRRARSPREIARRGSQRIPSRCRRLAHPDAAIAAGLMKARSTGIGMPLSSSIETRASPTANSEIALATSSFGLAACRTGPRTPPGYLR